MAQKIAFVLTAAAILVLGLFALQNLSDVEVSFLLWSFHAKKYIIVLAAALLGLLAGFLLGRLSKHARQNSP